MRMVYLISFLNKSPSLGGADVYTLCLGIQALRTYLKARKTKPSTITDAVTVTIIGNQSVPNEPNAFAVSFTDVAAVPVVAPTKELRTVKPIPKTISLLS